MKLIFSKFMCSGYLTLFFWCNSKMSVPISSQSPAFRFFAKRLSDLIKKEGFNQFALMVFAVVFIIFSGGCDIIENSKRTEIYKMEGYWEVEKVEYRSVLNGVLRNDSTNTPNLEVVFGPPIQGDYERFARFYHDRDLYSYSRALAEIGRNSSNRIYWHTDDNHRHPRLFLRGLKSSTQWWVVVFTIQGKHKPSDNYMEMLWIERFGNTFEYQEILHLRKTRPLPD